MAGLFQRVADDARTLAEGTRSNIRALPMMQEFEAAYREKEHDPKMHATGRLCGNLFVLYLANAFLYTSFKCTMPHYFGPMGDWAVYYAKVAMTVIYIEVMANWLCVKCYQSFVTMTRDSPLRDDEMAIQINGEGNEKKRLKWKYCEKCDLQIPPRAHHCRVCSRCVLKRDHHCFILGTCIGYWNQRFFFIFSFWIAIGCTIGEYFVYVYLRDVFFPTTTSYTELFLPVAIYNWIYGNNVSLDTVIILSLFYLLWLGTGFGVNFFLLQLSAICAGKTSHEAFKRARIRVRTGIADNMRSVFGPFWPLNFLFPAHIVYKQPGDGTQWDEITTY